MESMEVDSNIPQTEFTIHQLSEFELEQDTTHEEETEAIPRKLLRVTKERMSSIFHCVWPNTLSEKQKKFEEKISEALSSFNLKDQELPQINHQPVTEEPVQFPGLVPQITFKKARGERSFLFQKKQNRESIFLEDIEKVLLYIIHGYANSPEKPKCFDIRMTNGPHKCVLLVYENINLDNIFSSSGTVRQFFLSTFDISSQLFLPSPSQKFLTRSLSTIVGIISNVGNLMEEHGSPEIAYAILRSSCEIYAQLLQQYNIPIVSGTVSDTKIRKTQLIISPSQLDDFGFPIPKYISFGNQSGINNPILKEISCMLDDSAALFALDIENTRNPLRVTVTKEDGGILLDRLLHRENSQRSMVEFENRFGKLSDELTKNIRNNVDEVVQELITKLPDSFILVGHDLAGDLKALKVSFPFLIDTSLIYTETSDPNLRPSLKTIVLKHLGETIQEDKRLHDPVIDCTYAMKMVQLKLGKYMFSFVLEHVRENCVENKKKMPRKIIFEWTFSKHQLMAMLLTYGSS